MGTFISEEILSEGGITGTSVSATTITGTNFSGDGSGLTNISATFNGGTVTGETTFTSNVNISGTTTVGGDVVTSQYLKSLNSSGDEGGEIFLNKSVTNTTLVGGVTIDVYQDKLRFFEQGGTARGAFIDISSVAAGVGTDLTNIPVQSSTSGVGVSPANTQTDTITHGLGRTPVKIRIYGLAQFTSNAAATPTPFSIGTWTSSGNRCIYQPIGASLTTTVNAATSTTFAIRIDTAAGSRVEGVIGLVDSTTFSISWTETGTAASRVYMWEAE